MRGRINRTLLTLAWLAFSPMLITIALIARLLRTFRGERLIWSVVLGCTPIINYKYWAGAIQLSGHRARTLVDGFYSINTREDWDDVVRVASIARFPITLAHTIRILLKDDIVITSFDGLTIRSFFAWRMEAHLLRIAGLKSIVIPYGSDGYVYRRIASPFTQQALMTAYPRAARHSRMRVSRLDHWNRLADFVIPSGMTFDGFDRWDILIPNSLSLDLAEWHANSERAEPEGKLRVFHSSNHDAIKGTSFLETAVRELNEEGVPIELRVARGWPNDQVKEALSSWADIHVDQLILAGYGMSAIEGMATGVPVIANLSDPNLELFRKFSFLGECPIVSADTSSIKKQLRRLATDEPMRSRIGLWSREYVVNRHSLESGAAMFSVIFEFLRGERPPLLDFYYPDDSVLMPYHAIEEWLQKESSRPTE